MSTSEQKLDSHLSRLLPVVVRALVLALAKPCCQKASPRVATRHDKKAAAAAAWSKSSPTVLEIPISAQVPPLVQ